VSSEGVDRWRCVEVYSLATKIFFQYFVMKSGLRVTETFLITMCEFNVIIIILLLLFITQSADCTADNMYNTRKPSCR